MTNFIGVVYVKTEIELLGPIWLGAVYEKNQTGHDVTDCIGVVYAETEIELSRPIELHVICYENQIVRQDQSYFTVHLKNKTKLSWPIGPGVIYDENKTWQRRDQLYKSGLLQNQNWTIGTHMIEYSLW